MLSKHQQQKRVEKLLANFLLYMCPKNTIALGIKIMGISFYCASPPPAGLPPPKERENFVTWTNLDQIWYVDRSKPNLAWWHLL